MTLGTLTGYQTWAMVLAQFPPHKHLGRLIKKMEGNPQQSISCRVSIQIVYYDDQHHHSLGRGEE